MADKISRQERRRLEIKERKQNKNRSNKKTFSPRNILIAGGLTGLLVGLGFFYFNKLVEIPLVINGVTNYDEVRKGLIFIDDETDTELNPTQESDFKAGLRGDVGSLDVVIERATERSWVVFYDDPKDFPQNEDQLKGYTDSLFEFVNNPQIVKPNIRIKIPKKGDILNTLAEGDFLDLYIVRLTGDELKIYYSLRVDNDKIEGFSSKLFFNSGHTGTLYSYAFSQENRRLSYLEQKRGNIFYSPAGNNIDRVQSAAIECLHRAFAPWTAANLHRHVDSYYAEHDTDNNMVPWIISRNTELEEGLVHTIAWLWLERNLGVFTSITKSDLEKDLENYRRDDRYKMVDYCISLIKKIGIDEVINRYTSGQLKLNVK